MKNWAIVEDRPWVMSGFIADMKKKAREEQQTYRAPRILYYIAGETPEQQNAAESNYATNLRRFQNENQVEVMKINQNTFGEELNSCYEDDFVIFMDLNLTGNNAMYFNERINVQYAREKHELCEKQGKKEKQIWFYTTGASLDANFLQQEFEDNVINVEKFEDGKAELDINMSWKLLSEQV